MIFASFGNSPRPFIRLARAIDQLATELDENVIVQTGHTDYAYTHAVATKFLTREEIKEKLRECDVAILQGGWGTIAEASELGCRIVCVPRIKGEEHYHDQSQLVQAMERKGVLIGCYDIARLPVLVQSAKVKVFNQIETGDASRVINSYIDSCQKKLS